MWITEQVFYGKVNWGRFSRYSIAEKTKTNHFVISVIVFENCRTVLVGHRTFCKCPSSFCCVTELQIIGVVNCKKKYLLMFWWNFFMILLSFFTDCFRVINAKTQRLNPVAYLDTNMYLWTKCNEKVVPSAILPLKFCHPLSIQIEI